MVNLESGTARSRAVRCYLENKKKKMIYLSPTEFRRRVNELKSYVEKGNIKRAIKRSFDISGELGSREIAENILILSARYHRIEKENLEGVIPFEAYNAEVNRITKSVLAILSNLYEAYEVGVKAEKLIEQNAKNKNSNPVFVGKDITKKFEEFELSKIQLEIKEGTILGLVGENGSGKTTLMQIISGLLERDDGELIYFGDRDNGWYSIRQKIAYISQIPPRWILPLKATLAYICRIKTDLSLDEMTFEVDKTINRLGLNFFESHDWDSLSGGYKTRFELARALISNPKLLVLDEPLAHLDPRAQYDFLQDVRDIISQSNSSMAALISSQHIQEVEMIADEILVLSNGKTKFYGNKSEIPKKLKSKEIEIICDVDVEFLSNKIKKFNSEIDLIQKGRYNILSIPISVRVTDVVDFLISEGIELFYLNDIY